MGLRNWTILAMALVTAALLSMPFLDGVQPADAGPPASSCGNGILEIGERCDPPGSTCGSPFGGLLCDPSCRCQPASSCGNGIIDAGETCDPAGQPQPPNGNLCRDDCTFCGDAIVQPGETCDDGNTGFSCPPPPTDFCNNDCTGIICKEPAWILFKARKPDLFKLDGLLVPGPLSDPSQVAVGLSIENSGGVFFNLSLPAGSLSTRNGRLYVSRDRGAKANGGVALFRLLKRPGRPPSIVIKAFGDLSGATEAHMRLIVTIGGEQFGVEADWRQLRRGWFVADSKLS